MDPKPITSRHIQMMQQVVDFLQTHGWNVEQLSIYRYDDEDEAFSPREAWKKSHYKWGLSIRTSPQDDDKVEALRPHHHPNTTL